MRKSPHIQKKEKCEREGKVHADTDEVQRRIQKWHDKHPKEAKAKAKAKAKAAPLVPSSGED